MMQHKWGWPFLKPVDVAALNLVDYHTVLETLNLKPELENPSLGTLNLKILYLKPQLLSKTLDSKVTFSRLHSKP